MEAKHYFRVSFTLDNPLRNRAKYVELDGETAWTTGKWKLINGVLHVEVEFIEEKPRTRFVEEKSFWFFGLIPVTKHVPKLYREKYKSSAWVSEDRFSFYEIYENECTCGKEKQD